MHVNKVKGGGKTQIICYRGPVNDVMTFDIMPSTPIQNAKSNCVWPLKLIKTIKEDDN